MTRGEQLDELLRVAAREGMDSAIKKLGTGLTPLELTALRSLTQAELVQLSTLKVKLSPLKRVAADNNNGGVW